MAYGPISRRDAGSVRLRSIQHAHFRNAGGDLFHGIFSAEIPDRHDSIVLVRGIDDKNFRRNPVMLLGHGGDLPIGRVVSLTREEFRVGRKSVPALGGSFRFANSAEAQRVKSLVEEGHIAGLSIAFIPLDERRVTPEEAKAHAFRNPDRATVVTRSELIELSVVPIPSNPFTLIEAPLAREIEEARVVARALRSIAPQESRSIGAAIREAERLARVCASRGATAAFCDRAKGRNAAELAAAVAGLASDTAAILRGGGPSNLDEVSALLQEVRRDLAGFDASPTSPDLDAVTRTLRGLSWGS